MELNESFGIDEIHQNLSSLSAYVLDNKNSIQQQVTCKIKIYGDLSATF